MSVEMSSRLIRPLVPDQRFNFKLGKAEHESGMAVTSTRNWGIIYKLCSPSVLALLEHVKSCAIVSKKRPLLRLQIVLKHTGQAVSCQLNGLSCETLIVAFTRKI